MFKKNQVRYEREYDMMAMRLLVIHGPNLNLLGTREPQTYGSTTLAELNAQIEEFAQKENVTVKTFQSNHEGVLIDRIHQAKEEAINFIVINPGAFTHTSIALRDALAGVDIPFIEVHLSNVHRRESFRHHSYFSDIAVGVVAGFGTFGYLAAMQHAINQHNLLHR